MVKAKLRPTPLSAPPTWTKSQVALRMSGGSCRFHPRHELQSFRPAFPCSITLLATRRIAMRAVPPTTSSRTCWPTMRHARFGSGAYSGWPEFYRVAPDGTLTINSGPTPRGGGALALGVPRPARATREPQVIDGLSEEQRRNIPRFARSGPASGPDPVPDPIPDRNPNPGTNPDPDPETDPPPNQESSPEPRPALDL